MNRLRLTVVGEGFKDLTEEFLKTFDDYCQSAYDIASSRYTKIRVGIPPFLSTIITKKLFPEFSVQHPNIRLEIVEVGLIDGLNKLNSSQLDCLIGVCRSKTFTCNSRCLFTTKLTLAVNQGSELVHRHKAISIAQMESIPLVTPVKGSYLYSLINEILSEKPNIVMQSNQLTTLKYMLRVDCAAAIIYDGLFTRSNSFAPSSFSRLLIAAVIDGCEIWHTSDALVILPYLHVSRKYCKWFRFISVLSGRSPNPTTTLSLMTSICEIYTKSKQHNRAFLY